jgi:hypothetical protein
MTHGCPGLQAVSAGRMDGIIVWQIDILYTTNTTMGCEHAAVENWLACWCLIIPVGHSALSRQLTTQLTIVPLRGTLLLQHHSITSSSVQQGIGRMQCGGRLQMHVAHTVQGATTGRIPARKAVPKRAASLQYMGYCQVQAKGQLAYRNTSGPPIITNLAKQGLQMLLSLPQEILGRIAARVCRWFHSSSWKALRLACKATRQAVDQELGLVRTSEICCQRSPLLANSAELCVCGAYGNHLQVRGRLQDFSTGGTSLLSRLRSL